MLVLTGAGARQHPCHVMLCYSTCRTLMLVLTGAGAEGGAGVPQEFEALLLLADAHVLMRCVCMCVWECACLRVCVCACVCSCE